MQQFLCLDFLTDFIFVFQAISIFTVIGLIFIPVGLASLFASESVRNCLHTYLLVYYIVSNYRIMVLKLNVH